ALDFTGDVPFEYTVTDDNANPAVDDATVTIEVIGSSVPNVNEPPVANDDTNTTEKDITVSGNVLPNDSDPDGDPITVTSALVDSDGDGLVDEPLTLSTPTPVYGTDPEGDLVLAGVITLNPDGSYTFDPEPDFTGNVPADYTISDPDGLMDSATLTITVAEDLGNATYANDDANVGPQDVVQTGNVLANDNDPEGDNQAVTGATDSNGGTVTVGVAATLPSGGTLTANADGSYTYTPAPGFVGTEVVEYAIADDGTPAAKDVATLYLTTLPLGCLSIEAWVYLEGAAIAPDGTANYTLPMRTALNGLSLLPGQTYDDLFFGTFYTPAGQPYAIAPWNYLGTEGDAYDSGGDVNFADAGYPITVVDWVLVSLRTDPGGTGGPLCQAAALLHNDGRIEFVDEFDCCNIDLAGSYYLVVEHRNHLIVMSQNPVPVVDGKLTYDFRIQQTYIDDPFGFDIFVGQKEVAPGVFVMYGGNGNQTLSSSSDTDVNFDDRTFWESENGEAARYRIGDYNLNGDTNFNDRRVWELNNGKFTSVPRD
ncbi:MAG: cadherin-like domain-containing protein, partial [Phaeodactylibacter sp.]|nr:cadherin-like domain-containing protein [Phaeodactylibacter sp.]